MGEALDLPDEARRTPETPADLFVALTTGPQAEHPAFQGRRQARPMRSATWDRTPLDHTSDVVGAAVEPPPDLFYGDAFVEKRKDPALERSEM